MENAELKIRKIFVVHVNNKYKRFGEIDIKQLVVQTEVTKKVKNKIEKTKEHIQEALNISRSKTPPDFSPRHVGLKALEEWMIIYEILFPQKHPHNIYKLTYLNPQIIGDLEDLGIKLIADIPDGFKLNNKQKRQVRAVRENRQKINKVEI